MVFEKWGDPSYVFACSEDAVNDRFLPPSDLSKASGTNIPTLLASLSPPAKSVQGKAACHAGCRKTWPYYYRAREWNGGEAPVPFLSLEVMNSSSEVCMWWVKIPSDRTPVILH